MKISVVVVAHNSADSIEGCLDSIFAQKYEELEVIVVDNGSSDRTVSLITERSGRYPAIALISNSRNEGAAKARNQALKQASGEWVLTLDADAALENNFIASFLRFIKSAQEQERLGIIVPKILYPHTRMIYAIGNQLTLLRRFYDVGRGRMDHGQFADLREVFGACSAAALYRRSMLSEMENDAGGIFDEEFFFMAEDVDLAWRARKKNWKARVCHAAIGYHTGNGSGLDIRQKKYYSIRNRFVMMLKNDRASRIFLFFLPFLVYEFFRLSYLVLKGEGGVYASAFMSACGILKKRREKT